MSDDAHPCRLPSVGERVADVRCDRADASRVSPALLDRLTEISLDDLFDAAGWMRLRRTPLRRVLRPYARRFALVAHEFDNLVGDRGLAHGSAWLVRRMAAGAQVSGGEHVPASGPAVVLANHPGMTDTVALIAGLASRPDLRVIALDRPFLLALPNVARHLILVTDHEVGRTGVLRAGVKHLKEGGALLTFPAGEIEPDPATFGRHSALESARRWSDSFVLFARRVPQTRFIPAVVSNVVSPQAQANVLTRLRRTARDRQRLAAALQVILPRYQTGVGRVAFGPALQAAGRSASALSKAIADEIRELIEATEPAETGVIRNGARRGAVSPTVHGSAATVPRTTAGWR